MVVATVVPASAEAVPTLNLGAICRGIAAHATAKRKAECVGEATAGGLSSYTDLLTCLQLTRGVEQMRHQKR
jgi:hypothetical protein